MQGLRSSHSPTPAAASCQCKFALSAGQWQDMVYGGRHSSSYMESLPDFVKLAESYGHVGMQINHLDELEDKLTEAFNIKNRLVFVDVLVDEKEHVYPMQIRLGAIDEMWIKKGVKS